MFCVILITVASTLEEWILSCDCYCAHGDLISKPFFCHFNYWGFNFQLVGFEV